jgi:atrial natriuretic peptide receptor A
MTDGKLNEIQGRQLVQRMRNMSFSGISGNVTIDSDGDRIADYALLDQTDPESGLFKVLIKLCIIY